ncbi:hypothetical protein HX021_20500 [Sphingobacterium sp. N143]|uniref:hypothetical protein n=1 Tax=Sphingobacterium sp. N143 TaxID=2746727 RepID=UPI002578AD49|nr:hypothetical protein [Sphingobacterium sp. N143]MDM1296670.1 hypothetical protein [Sphingobacterium sp. N143]
MKKYLSKYAMITFAVGILSLFQYCQSSGHQEEKQHEESNTTTDIRSSKRIHSASITQKVTFPNMPFEKLMRLMDLTNKNSPLQLQQAIATLPASEKRRTDSFNIENPVQQMELLLAPLLMMEIKFDQEQAHSSSAGLTYRLQHHIRYNDDSGEAFIANQKDPAVHVNFSYNKQDLGGLAHLQVPINPKDYMIDKTGKTKEIAGITCQQAIYHKIDQDDKTLPKFVIWKSPRIPKGINRLYPYVFSENEGILEIDAYLNQDENSLLRYTTTAVLERDFEPHAFDVPGSPIDFGKQFNQDSLNNKILDVILHQ